MFLAHMTPFYPDELVEFPKELGEFLRVDARTLPSGLRCHVTQALILLINRQIVDIRENLALFMELQTLGDRVLRKLAFDHVVHSIKRMNQKHKNEAKNRALQNILFSMLQQEDEAKAKRSLITLCDLHKRKVWFDDRTANAICTACFHPSSRIMIASLSFLLDYENIEDDDDESDGSSSEDDQPNQQPQVLINREAIYKAHHTGTSSSKKKKKAKLQRAIRSMKRQQRSSLEKNDTNYYSPLNHLKDAQGFTEKLFSRLQTCNERFEIKMMMLKVISRTVGLHRLVLMNFYPYLQKYLQPHQRDITSLLAAAVQTCHDMVPPDAVEPLFKQIVNQFVHDRSRTEAIAVGLNVVREICLRMPLLMTEDLLQDLVLYRKSHEKAVSSAARSLLTLFREVCPSLLIKKDRGRPTDPKAKPKAYGEVNVSSNVPGVELLEDDNDEDAGGSINGEDSSESDIGISFDDDEKEAADFEEDSNHAGGIFSEGEDGIDGCSIKTGSEDEIEDGNSSENDADESGDFGTDSDKQDCDDESEDDEKSGQFLKVCGSSVGKRETKTQKRKFADFDGQLNAADTSLRALKRLAGDKAEPASSDAADGILSNEDFKRIKELKAKKDAKTALAHHGLLKKGDAKATAFKVPSSEQLSAKRVDPAKLEAHMKQKLSKDERLALIRAGREDRGKYQARTAIKQKKTGGLSNRQKEHKKAMPIAAKRAKVAKSRQEKKRKQKIAGKQFRGRKAWK